MDRASVTLLIMGVLLAPVGIYLATYETCVDYIVVLGNEVCTARGIPYQAPGYALLILGILLFIVGLLLLVTTKKES